MSHAGHNLHDEGMRLRRRDEPPTMLPKSPQCRVHELEHHVQKHLVPNRRSEVIQELHDIVVFALARSLVITQFTLGRHRRQRLAFHRNCGLGLGVHRGVHSAKGARGDSSIARALVQTHIARVRLGSQPDVDARCERHGGVGLTHSNANSSQIIM